VPPSTFAQPSRLGRHHPAVTRLREAGRRRDAAVTVADGLKLVLDLAAGGVPIDDVFATPDALPAVLASPPLADLARAGRVFEIGEAALESAAPTRSPQGVLAIVRLPRRRLPVAGVILYLDRIQDPGNVGAVIRSAAAFGAAGVACSPGCADPFGPRALRASAGHSLLLPVTAEAAFAPLARAFAAAGGEVAGTVGADGTPLRDWRPHPPLLLALGNEGQGLGTATRSACGSLVSIPMSAGVESLNVAVSAGVVLACLAGVAGPPILGFRMVSGGRDDPPP
jgi:TrmH family RNA methyltransferase